MIHSWLRGRLQIVVSASVVVSFLLAAGVAWLRANTIEGDVADIVGNAMPSVELLTHARTDVRRLELAFEQLAQHPSAMGHHRLAVRSARRNLDASLAAYRTLPYFPAEQGLDRDTQDALAPEVEPTVFEPFVRGASNVAGIGLGLATVKRLAVAHGGRVGCRTRLGIGSTFWFELPPAAWAGSSERMLTA